MKTLILYLLIGVIYTIISYARTEIFGKGKSLEKSYDEAMPSTYKYILPYWIFHIIAVIFIVVFWPIMIGLGIIGLFINK